MHYRYLLQDQYCILFFIPEITMKCLSSLAVLGLLGVLLSSCGFAQAASSLTKLTFVRNATVNAENHAVPALHQTITNQATVQHLYQVAVALPHAPQGGIHCPAAPAIIDYQIHFYAGTIQVHTMNVRSMGCVFIQIDGESSPHAADNAFIQLFQQTFHLPSMLD
jgi:hypothetical protein